MLLCRFNLKLTKSGMRLLQQVRQDRLALRRIPVYLELALLVVGIDMLQAVLDLAEFLGGGVVAEVVPLLEGVLQIGDAVVEGLQILGYMVHLCGVVVVIVEMFGHPCQRSLGETLDSNSELSISQVRDCQPIKILIQ